MSQPLAVLPRADFSEEFVRLGYYVRIHVYTAYQTIGVTAQHHSGSSIGLKLIGDNMVAKNLRTVRRWVEEWIDAEHAKTTNGVGSARRDSAPTGSKKAD